MAIYIIKYSGCYKENNRCIIINKLGLNVSQENNNGDN